MRYADFRSAWDEALAGSGLRAIGGATERLELTRLRRLYEVGIEPLGGQDMEPFCVTAVLRWSWNPLQEARSATTEEDVLIELLGRDEATEIRTGRPWLRVDVELRATLPWGQSIAVPSQEALRAWMREAVGRLERTEPLLPDEWVEETPDGDLSILAWQGTPEVRASCTPDGELRLDGVHLEAWQAVTLPRIWDDPDRRDEGPREELGALFARVRRALHVWMESLDHLVRRPRS